MKSLVLLTSCCCALLLLASHTMEGQATTPLPPAPRGSVVDLTPQPGYFTEPAIAIDPNNPQQVVAAFQDNAHAGYSTDGGKTWHLAEGVSSTRFRVSGDVSIAYDTHGHAIICYMAFDKLGTFNYWGHDSSRKGLFVRRSMDGGATWEAQDIPVIQHADGTGVPWEDKPYLVADDSHGPHAGNLYIGWTRWTLTDSGIWLTRSTDDGATWSQPIEIDQHPGLPRDDNGALEGFAGAVAPDGTLYVVWAGDGWLQYTVSKDGGRTFSKPRNIIRTAPIMFQVEDVARSNGFPQIAVDAHQRGKQRLYVTWSDYRNGDVDVWTASSADNGRTWSAAVRVNDDPLHNGADQFFQWMTVDPTDGSVNVVFYDRRDDPRNRDCTVTLARSTDGGRSFKNYAWTTKPFNPGRAFLGDYTGIAALNGHVYGIWTTKPEPPPGSAGAPPMRGPGSTRGTQIEIGDGYFGKGQ